MASKDSEHLPFDPLSDVLALLKPASYGVRVLDAGGAWSVAFPAVEGIKCYALQEGACWLLVDGVGDALRLNAGDCVLPDGRAFTFCSEPGLP